MRPGGVCGFCIRAAACGEGPCGKLVEARGIMARPSNTDVFPTFPS